MKNNSKIIFHSNIKSLELINRGKVRDIYKVDDEHLLIVTSDRLSAFDVILPDPIPGKGHVLTEVSNFWFERFKNIIPNHITETTISDVINSKEELKILEGRASIVKKLKPLPIEAVVRGYLIGSGWEDYKKSGEICGISLSSGMRQAEKLSEPIFTPATKANVGDHDENISFDKTKKLIGEGLAKKIRDISLKIYNEAAQFTENKGIIIADTKFEFGLNDSNELILIDELLTPDSSRFWPTESYKIGISPPSFDKQYIRDYLETLDWNKKSPGPDLPINIIEKTSEKYQEAKNKIIN